MLKNAGHQKIELYKRHLCHILNFKKSIQQHYRKHLEFCSGETQIKMLRITARFDSSHPCPLFREFNCVTQFWVQPGGVMNHMQLQRQLDWAKSARGVECSLQACSLAMQHTHTHNIIQTEHHSHTQTDKNTDTHTHPHIHAETQHTIYIYIQLSAQQHTQTQKHTHTHTHAHTHTPLYKCRHRNTNALSDS